ncbi:hypothetical protein ACX80I_02470 [Arthrobacter sp. MDT3-44]
MTEIGSSGALEPRDLFRRNEADFRAEIRVGLKILSTKRLRIAGLTAQGATDRFFGHEVLVLASRPGK